MQPNRFMHLKESCKAIPEEHEIDSIDYDEVISSNDASL